MIYGINDGFRIIAKDTQKTFASFNRPTIQAEITMSFDSQGRRTEYKSVTNGVQNTWLRFLYDGYLCVQVLYSNEPYNVFKEFVWDPTEPVATRPLVFRYAPNSLNLFYAFDGNKNVSDVFYRMNSNGIGAHYDYAPFGNTTRTHRDSSASFDIVSLNPFRFSSEYYDSELDLVYYNYRHYSPSLGRFLSRDPIEEQGGWNLYAFVGNSGLDKFDVLGRNVYWASRDLDSFFIGNHHFILVAFFNGEPLPRGVASHEIKCEKNKCKKRHRIVTLSLERNSNGYISLSDSLESDRKAYKEEYCDERPLGSDYDYQASEVKSPFGSEKDFIRTIVKLYNNSKVNFLKRPVKYSLANKNCASWLNTLFSFAFISSAYREKSGEFSGFDWGEEDINFRAYFLDPPVFNRYAENNEI